MQGQRMCPPFLSQNWNQPIEMKQLVKHIGQVVFLTIWIALFVQEVAAQELSPVWEPPRPINDQCCAAYPVPIADTWGQLHLLWADADGYIWYTRRTDTGWLQPREVLANPGRNPAAGLDAAVDTTGRLHLIWRDGSTGNALYYASAFVQHADDARFWTAPVELAPKALGAALAVDAQNKVYVAYTPFEAGQSFTLIISEDGLEWSQPIAASSRLDNNFTGGSYVSMAIDAHNTIHVAWNSQHYPGGYPEHAVFYQRSTDGGVSWSEPYDPDPLPPEVDANTESNFKNKMLKVAVGPAGDVHLTWHQYTGYRFHRWSADGGVAWSEKESLFPDMGAAYNGPVDMAFDSSGRMHVVASKAAIWYRSRSIDGQWTPPELVDPTPADWHHHRVAVVSGNQIYLFYPDINETGILWSTHKTAAAPAVAPLPLPTSIPAAVTATPRPMPASTTASVRAALVTTVTPLSEIAREAPYSAYAVPFWLVALGPAFLLVCAVTIVYLRRQR